MIVSNSLVFDKVDIVTPDGMVSIRSSPRGKLVVACVQCLVRELCFKVNAGEHMLVTGPNASGKVPAWPAGCLHG